MDLKSPDAKVRAQIDAIKVYLEAEGLVEVEDPRELQGKAVFEQNLHTIRATLDGEARILRVGYGWLEERTPQGAVEWVQDHGVVARFRADYREVKIHDDGHMSGPLDYSRIG